jgi:hypothetical protein
MGAAAVGAAVMEVAVYGAAVGARPGASARDITVPKNEVRPDSRRH